MANPVQLRAGMPGRSDTADQAIEIIGTGLDGDLTAGGVIVAYDDDPLLRDDVVSALKGLRERLLTVPDL